jgi:hypothetical protein
MRNSDVVDRVIYPSHRTWLGNDFIANRQSCRQHAFETSMSGLLTAMLPEPES